MSKVKYRVTRLSGIKIQFIFYPFNSCIWLTDAEVDAYGIKTYLKAADEITPEFVAQIIRDAISSGDRVSITHNGTEIELSENVLTQLAVFLRPLLPDDGGVTLPVADAVDALDLSLPITADQSPLH